MKKDKLKLYLLEFFLLAFLFFALIVSNKINDIVIAIIVAIICIIACIFFPKGFRESAYKRQVTIMMLGFGLIYLGFYYLLGFISFSFYKSPVSIGIKPFLTIVLPLAVVIIASEILRNRLISQDGTITILKVRKDLSKLLIFIIAVLIDLLVYIRVYDLTNLDEFLTAIGFVLFASISCNLFYNYVSVRFDFTGIVIYRIITMLYMYVIPIIPNVYIYFKSFLRMIYPYILYLVLEKAYAKSDFVTPYREKRGNLVGITIVALVMTTLIMLISCKFRYGILVVGSESMTGTLNVGDAVFFEKYKNQQLKSNDIIIFEQNGLYLVHRIVKVERVNGIVRYYTKGDANTEIDDWILTTNNISGVVQFKMSYVGYPSLWLRSIFK